MNQFWYYYIRLKYGGNAKLGYMNTDSFIFHVKIEDIYKHIVEDAEVRFDTWNCKLDRSLANGKHKKVIGLVKDELVGQILK